jgi:xanthine dehydrogenase YagR molybdenum-binding subunit
VNTIGQPLARVDGRVKVIGAAIYAAEFQRPKLTYGALIQSTIANGHVVKIDLSAAKSAPGVLGILTRENAPHFKAYPDDLRKPGAPGENRVPLQDDAIYHDGQHLGVVVADRVTQERHPEDRGAPEPERRDARSRHPARLALQRGGGLSPGA